MMTGVVYTSLKYKNLLVLVSASYRAACCVIFFFSILSYLSQRKQD